MADPELLGEVTRGAHFALTRVKRADGKVVLEKRVRPDGPDPVGAAQRLRREHRLLESLAVAGVARPLAFADGAEPLLVLADGGGATLASWQAQRALPPRTFLRLALELAEIVSRLHERGIVHRALAPASIVIDEHEHLTLVDFDAATRVPGAGHATALGARHFGIGAGIAAYLAPEELGYTGRLVDRRADLYSLGATFCELLTGAAPVAASGALAAVPAALSDIVVRLMARRPDARYQSADALVADLQEAERRLDRTGAIAPFELGGADQPREPPLPDWLYEREEARARLLAAWASARAGAAASLVISGAEGVGKTALAHELGEVATADGGRFVHVGGDATEESPADGPVARLVRALVASHLAGPALASAAAASAWAASLRTALGTNTRLITDLSPELARLVGPLPALPPLAPHETRSRLEYTFQSFVRLCAAREHPLAIVLDDLPWGGAGRALVAALLRAAIPYTIIIMVHAAREHAVLDAVGPGEGGLGEIALAPLGEAAVATLCGDFLRRSIEECRPLAIALRRKTAGNPLFLRRLLRHLCHLGAIHVEPGVRRWGWELAAIEGSELGDDVAAVLAAGLERQPEAVRRLVEVSACIGQRVPDDVFELLDGVLLTDTDAALSGAVRAGFLVVDVDGCHRFVHASARQAALALMDDGGRAATHLAIGRRLERQFDPADPGERLLLLAEQLNRGAALVAEPGERLRLAELDLRAGQRARELSAYGAALRHFEAGIALLPAPVPPPQRALALDLHRAAMTCAHITGAAALAARRFADALALCDSLSDQAALYDVAITANLGAGATAEAMQAAEAGLALYGVDINASALAAARPIALAELEAALAGRRADELLCAPAMEAAQDLAFVRLLASAMGLGSAARPDLVPVLVARLLTTTVTRGANPHSALAFVHYADLVMASGDHRRAQAYANLGVELARRFGDPAQEGKVLSAAATLLTPWSAPLSSTLPLLRRAQALALDAGDLVVGVASSTTAAMHLYHQGAELGRVLREIDACASLARSTNVTASLDVLAHYRAAIRRLQGWAEDARANVEAGAGPELAYGPPTELSREVGQIRELELAHLFRDLDAAERLVAALARASFQGGFVLRIEARFHATLALAAGQPRAGVADPARLAQMQAATDEIARFVAVCPDNHRQKHLLMRAEIARVLDQPSDAAGLYDQAIEAARAAGLVQDEAIANEVAGRFHRAHGRRRFARLYLGAAVEAYTRWGAKAKAEALLDEFLDLEGGGDGSHAGEGTATPLDRVALFRAAEAISGEVVLDRLVPKLMNVCLGTAGAERGAFVLEDDGRWFVRWVGSAEGGALERTPLAESTALSVAAVERACSALEPLVVADAAQHATLRHEPYVASRGVRSVLAVPVQRHGRAIAVLYLENNLAARVFIPDRVRLLLLLSAQISVAIENSLLFQGLAREIEDRKRAQSALEFLAETGAALGESLDRAGTLERVARLVAGSALADWCAIDLVGSTPGAQLRGAAIAHHDPDAQVRLASLRQELDQRGQALGGPVCPAGDARLWSDVDAAVMADWLPDPALRALIARVDVASVMMLPLRAHGRMLGVMTLAAGRTRRRYVEGDLELGRELARRAALAIDNARLYSEAQEAIRLRDDFLSIASHELNTPIASLQLSAQTLDEHARDEKSELAKLAQIVTRQTRRLDTLITQLLDVTRIRSGDLHLRLESVELGNVVRAAVDGFAEPITRAGCPVSVAAERPVTGIWDRRRIEQVVTSLLSNAVKFSLGRPVQITVSEVKGRARLVVADNGIGIAPERLPHVFGRFERAVSASHYGGLGLGLFIVREIVSALGGSAEVHSELGVGSRFTVELPLRS